MIEVKNLTKLYGKFKAVDDVSLCAADGEVTILLGPNGAGKSTTIKSITNLLQYKGDIKINGVANSSLDAKKGFGYIPEAPVLYDLLTIDEHVEFIGKAYRCENYRALADEYITLFKLEDKRKKAVRELSKGMKQKVSMLLQKKKALCMEADAFYLFSGPFTRVQTMRFLMLQNIASAFLCGAVSLLMVILLGSTIELSFPFLLIAFLCFSFVYFVFLVVYYYVYLLSIQKDSYRHIPAIAALLYVLMVAAVYGMVVLQNDFALTGSGTLFLNTELFYWVPLFGWIKMILVSYIASSWGLMLLGIGLLLISCMVVYLLLCGYKGDFVERAMQDAQEFTALYKDVRAGKRDGMSDRKIHEVKASFRSGAMAIFSKNVLLLRKSNDYIRWTDVMTIGIYLVITLIMDMGFGFFMYMMMFWLFTIVQNSDFMKDMNNYQIYLIPDHPLKKLLCVLLPTFLKMLLPMSAAILVAALLYQTDIASVLQYFIMLLGYATLFLSASVLSVRILKSRNNAIMENMLRMLIMVAAAAPGIGLTIFFLSRGEFTLELLQQLTMISLAMNFVISVIIVLVCAPMMNGREIKSE